MGANDEEAEASQTGARGQCGWEEDTEGQQDTEKGHLGPDNGGCWRPDQGIQNSSCRE